MSKFLNRLNEGKEETQKKANNLVVANAKAQVETKVASLTAKAATLDAAYEAAFSSNFSIEKVFTLTREIADNKADLELAKSILSSEFAD